MATFCGPLLAHTTLLAHGVAAASGTAMARQAVALRLWTLAVYLGVLVALRDHLFVWTVFAPRFLYDASFTAVCTVEVGLLQAVGG